MKQRDNQFAEP